MAPFVVSALTLSAFLLLPSPAHALPRAKDGSIVWSYMGGGNDDENWGTLSNEFAACMVGQQQSPVGIEYTTPSAMLTPEVAYHASKVTIEKKDRTLVMDVADGNSIVDNATPYRLVQIRVHTPAEHQIKGLLYPLELHLIHQSADGKTLIIGVIAKVDEADQPGLKTILDHAPAKAGERINFDMNPEILLPAARGIYAYTGSLTWPPCTEGVEWRIYKQPIIISKAQMRAFGALLGRNARLLQPLYLRTIRETLN